MAHTKMSDALVKTYVTEKMKLDVQNLKVASLAHRIRRYQKRGLVHPLIQFQDNVSWRPNWKKLVAELTKKYMKDGQRVIYMKHLKRRFKPKRGLVKICIATPKYDEHRERINALREKYGLKSETTE